MNKSLRRFAFSCFAMSAAAAAVADTAVAQSTSSSTLFPSNQFTTSVFGESADGNVDIDSGQKTVEGTQTTTTTTSSVSAPTPTPSPTRGQTAIKPLFRTTTTAVTLPDGQTVTTTFTRNTKKTHRVVPTNHVEHNAGGGGVQLSWFFNRYVGLAIEGDFLGGDPYVTDLTGQLIVRYPFEFGQKPITGYSKDAKDIRTGKDGKDYKGMGMTGPTWGLAPYFICGGGAQWDGRCDGIADVGGGLEIRFADHWGTFCDGRWIVTNDKQNYGACRAGISYSF